MGAGGIINQRAAVLLVAATDTCIYSALSPNAKTVVDAIDAKDPLSRDQHDINQLLLILEQVCRC